VKILYVTTNFSALSHTFITREIGQLRRLGCEIDLLALRRIAPELQAKIPECDVSGCRYVYPTSFISAMVSLFTLLVRKPGTVLNAAKVAVSDPTDKVGTKAKLLFQLAVASALVKRTTAGDYDLIHAHFASPPTSFAMLLSLLTGIPYTFTGHGADVYRDVSALRPKLLHAAGAVGISEYNLNYYRTLVPNMPPTAIVRCGINLDLFPYQARRDDGGEIRILTVGRCVPKKGFAVMVDALSELRRRGVPWSAAIVGDGPILDELKGRAETAGISSNLEFTGALSLDQVREHLNRANIFVMPSIPAPDGDIDGIPVSLMEAMANGCSVVSTAVSGIPELVIEGETGLLVPPDDPTALADAIGRLIEHKDLRTSLSTAGRRYVEDNFSLASAGTTLLEFFSGIVQNHRRLV